MTCEARAFLGLAAAAAMSSSVGCATTGLSWVNEPESGVEIAPPADGTRWAAPPGPTYYPPAAETPPLQRSARHRLDHTITLGEVTVLDARADPPPVSREGTVVNVYLTPATLAPTYAGYGASYGFGLAPFASVPVSAIRANTVSPPMRPGLDWPAVPNHGTPFPYRTAPAPPWEGTGPRRR